MSNARGWSSKVRGGRNIALENSFRISFNNQTGTIQNPQFFSLGSQGTPNYVSAPISLFLTCDLITAGVIDISFKFVNNTYLILRAYDYGVFYTFLVPIGTLIFNLPTLTGKIYDPYGNVADTWYVQQNPINLRWDFSFPNIASAQLIFALTLPPILPINLLFEKFANPLQQPSSYDPNNPFIVFATTTAVPITAIQQSGIDNSYGVLCIDIYSDDKQQVLQPINYQYKDVNGNDFSFGADPIVNPYQPQVGSISCVDLERMQLNQETTLSYQVLPEKTAIVTVNYVKFSIWDYYEFDKVFAQQLRDNFLLQKRLLDKSRMNALQIE